jgi:hypothetical protein
VTFTLNGFAAGETVDAVLHSTPQTLASATASTTGALSYSFTVPSGLPDGAHSVVFTGATSGVTETWPFTLGDPTPSATVPDEQVDTSSSSAAGAPTLPFTGANIGKPLLFGVAALWSGLILMLLGRRSAAAVALAGRRGPGFGRHRAT